MAELIAGAFLSSFFPFVFERLASKDFKDLFHKRLVKELTMTLNCINQLLEDAETKQYKKPLVKNWLDDVKHEVYEVDQLLDEIALEQRKSKAKRFFSTLTNPFESRIKGLLVKLNNLAEKKDWLELTESYDGAVGLQFSKIIPTASLVDESSICGRMGEKEEIINHLLSTNDNDKQVSVISIVGLGGMGKTTLAQLVYNDQRIEKRFDLRAWVHVPKSFDVVGLTKTILRSFESTADGEDLNPLICQLQKTLTGKKFLLVLDDVWKGNIEECWEQLLLALNRGSSESKIFVTTRETQVASFMKSDQGVTLQQLEEKDCWELFVKHAFRGKNQLEHPELESIGKKILHKCGGLPLAVKTLGNLLQKKFSQDQWEKILETDLWCLSERDSNINPFESSIKGLLVKLNNLAEKKDWLGLTESYDGAVGLQFSKIIPTASLVDESSICGRKGEKEEIINYLLSTNDNDKQVSVISIVGLGGMGKTTLAQLVYNDQRIEKQFKLKAWVHVPKSLDVVGLTKTILRSFKSTAYGEAWVDVPEYYDIFHLTKSLASFHDSDILHPTVTYSNDLKLIQRLLQQKLMGKKYLLVLDGVCKMDGNTWEQLQILFNCGSSGSKMIVTTRDKEVASIMGSTRLLHLKQLEENDSWSLFVNYAFGVRNVFEYPNDESIGKKIIKKCDGLPLALKTLAGILQTKSSESEWVKKILETDLWHLPEEVDNRINSILRLSYFNFPSNLKRCFAYCSIFPKGYEFEKGELINLWMAQGLLKCWGRHNSEEELGNEFFDHLVSISFFRQSVIMPFWTGKYYFIMHDFVNDLAKSVSGESHLRIEGDNVQDIPERTRHIWCCLDLKDGDRKLEHIHKIKGLHSLMVEAQSYGDQRFKISTNVQRKLFSRLKYLRMLSFSSCNLLQLADEIRNLKLLCYLDLSYTEIASLPNSICVLYNLQSLLLQDCFKLTELPSDFYKLVNLRYLNLEGTRIKKMPMKIGGLNNLQILTDFVVGEQCGFDIKQLAELNHLQGRLQISGLENVIDPADAVGANLKDKKHLEELSMSYGEWREMDGLITASHVSVLEALQPNRKLMRLTIKNYRDRSLPNWLGEHHLPNLVSLELLRCKLRSQMPPLGQFASLKKLSISGCDGIEIIGTEFSGYNSSNVPFRSLETLRFEHMSEWKEWLSLECFPLLQELCIKHCPKLKSSLPQHLPSLQKLEIIDCEELEASIPKADNISELELRRCDEILINELPSSLKKVILCGTRVIRSSLENILLNSAFLEELEVEDFFGPNLEWSSLDFISCNSLHTLTITGWHSSSLPFALHLFPNLNSLALYDSPWLESFYGRQLPSNLCSLKIERCPKLMASREEWGLFQLNSLKQFRVSHDFEIFESFPEESLLPSTINSLELTNCSNLRILNFKGLLHLTSLESLYIEDCPCLESLPEEGLPSSLSTLSIHDCPLIMQQYQKEQGERWHTISHIPDVIIS